MATEISTAPRPTNRLMRKPYRMALNISRPCESVPSQYVMEPSKLVAPGARRPSMMSSASKSYGFCGANSGASSTSTISRPRASKERLVEGLPRSLRSMRARPGVCSRGATRATGAVSGACVLEDLVMMLGISGSRLQQLNTWVQHCVQQVHHQIDHYKQQGHQHHVSHDYGAIQLIHAVDKQLAHARPGKHRFRDGGVGDQGAELHADDRYDGNQDVAQDMSAHDAAGLDALDRKSTRLNSSH